MLAYTPYMDPMGYESYSTKKKSHIGGIPTQSNGSEVEMVCPSYLVVKPIRKDSVSKLSLMCGRNGLGQIQMLLIHNKSKQEFCSSGVSIHGISPQVHPCSRYE